MISSSLSSTELNELNPVLGCGSMKLLPPVTEHSFYDNNYLFTGGGQFRSFSCGHPCWISLTPDFSLNPKWLLLSRYFFHCSPSLYLPQLCHLKPSCLHSESLASQFTQDMLNISVWQGSPCVSPLVSSFSSSFLFVVNCSLTILCFMPNIHRQWVHTVFLSGSVLPHSGCLFCFVFL